ncbi:MAG: hypothetical protein ABIR18_02405, partial [Chitinophagaceae bacterium]
LKIIRHAVKISLLLIISSTCFSQTETFDIATYTAPKDWKKETREGVVNYVNVNTGAGTFCVIAMYASTASTGDAQKDFKKAWNELVVTPFKAAPDPKTETQTEDGWKIVVAAAPVKQDDVDVYIILTVFSGFGKTFCMRTSLNDEAYTTQVDALLASMELDKTKTVAVNNNNTVSTAPATPGTGKFGLMRYTAPAGWSEQVFADGVVFKPLDLPAGEHLAIQIMQPLNVSGTLEQVLAQSFAEATTMYNATSMYQSDGKYSKNEARKSFIGWEYLRGKGGIRINDGTQFGPEYGLEVFVVKINNRFERVAILESRLSCKLSRYYTSDRVNYRNGIESLLYSFQFTDFTGSTLKSGSVNGPGVIGIWQGIVQSTSAPGFKIDTYSLILFDNGQVYYGAHFPTEGLDGLNSRIPPELYRRDWKTYTYSNGNGVLKMIFAEIPFRTQGDKLIITKNQMDWPHFKLKPVDGATFNGTYTMSAVNGTIPAITFTPDGRFIDNGALKVLYHEYVECTNPALLPGSGKYEVKNYTIHFTYTDGRKINIAFMGTDYNKSNPSPPILRMSFDDNTLTRQ